MGYDELHRSFGPEEGVSADEAKVRQMLGELNKVEAPKNFDFKLQARIANTRPEDLRKPESRLVFLRYAMPLLLVLVVISGVVVVGLYSVNNNDVPEVAYTAPARQADTAPVQPSSPAIVTPSNTVIEERSPAESTVNNAKPVEGQLIASSQPRRAERTSTGKDQSDDGSWSKVQSVSGPKPIIDLHNAKPTSAAPVGTGPRMPAGQLPVQELLDFSGIKTTYTNSGWRVNSVVPNTIADRAGIKTGDLIEGINGQPVTQGTKFSGEVGVRSLRVGRNGRSMDVQF